MNVSKNLSRGLSSPTAAAQRHRRPGSCKLFPVDPPQGDVYLHGDRVCSARGQTKWGSGSLGDRATGARCQQLSQLERGSISEPLAHTLSPKRGPVLPPPEGGSVPTFSHCVFPFQRHVCCLAGLELRDPHCCQIMGLLSFPG